MESFFFRMKVAASNLVNLIKSIFGKDQLYWSSNLKQLSKVKIGIQSKVFPPYSLLNVEIGKSTYINKNSYVSYASIGSFCSIGPNFICGWGIHPVDGISTSPVFYSSTKNSLGYTYSKEDKIKERLDIQIGSDVFIGANVTVLDGVKIGHGAIIGAGAVVTKDIPPYAVAVGCPIKVIRYRFSDEDIAHLLKICWWDKDVDTMNMVERDFFDVKAFIDKQNSFNP